MLKLEKIAKTRELNVLLRAKTTVFTPSFLFALAYALLVHLSALFFFQIAPFRVSYQQTIFPPVNVASEIPIHGGIYATHEHIEETPIPEFLIAPFPDKPSFAISHKIPSISLHLSGGIHALKLKTVNFHEKDLLRLAEADSLPIKFHFNVQVEQQNGEIFWWELTPAEKNKKMQEYAINVIKNLRFTPDPSYVILPGEIDLIILWNER